MKLVSRFILTNRKLLLGVSLFALVLMGGAAGKASAAGSNNDIMYGGFSSSAGFIGSVKGNDSGNNHHDLIPIYAHYGLESADYDHFVASAQPGYTNRAGQIFVCTNNDPTKCILVANNAQSIGRIKDYQGANPITVNIDGAGQYYGNFNNQAFAPGSDNLPVTVLFNSAGAVQFAVMNSCGNPIWGNNVNPNYACTMLHKTQSSTDQNTYTFTTDAAANTGASITSYLYNFGDGQSQSVTSGTTPVSHTYKTSGNYNVTVTVTVKLQAANTSITINSGNCATVVSIPPPTYSCVQLAFAVIDSTKYSYGFTAKAAFSGGTTFTGADFDFGDGNVLKNQKPTAANEVTVNHTYGDNKSYSTKATLYFDTTDGAKSVNCQVTIPTTLECVPGVPQGSSLCQCKYDSSLPVDSPKCIPPPAALPNTGAGDVIAIFGAAVAGGFLIFRQFIYKRQPQASGTATIDGVFAGPAVSEETGVVISQHLHEKHKRQHPNTVHPLYHPTYQHPHRFRPHAKDGDSDEK